MTAKKRARDTLHIVQEDSDMSPGVQFASSAIFESKNTCTSLQHPPSFHASTSTPLNPFSESLNKIASDVSVIKQNIKTILESNVTSKTTSTLVAKTNPNEDICMQSNDHVEILVAKVTLARSIKEIESADLFSTRRKSFFALSMAQLIAAIMTTAQMCDVWVFLNMKSKLV